MLGRFDDLVQLDDGWMPHQLQDMDLPTDSLHVGYIDDFILLQDLDRHLLPCHGMSRQFHLPKCALPDRLT